VVPAGRGHFLLGFFNAQTMNEWRTANTLVARINVRAMAFTVISNTAPLDGGAAPG